MRYYLISKWRTGIPVLVILFNISIQFSQANEQFSDEAIAHAIKEEYLLDEAIPEDDIDVQVRDGIVILEGGVTNLLSKNHAARIAETVKGVRTIANSLEVTTLKYKSASELRRDIETAFSLDPVVERYEVTVNARENGIVSLEGYVDSWQEKNFAGAVASSVNGVSQIINDIEVILQNPRPDEEIQAEVEKRIRWNALLNQSLINVQVEKGTVILSGMVGSSVEKSQARMAAWIHGTRDVEASELSVQPLTKDTHQRLGTFKPQTDEEIVSAITAAFVYDPRLYSNNIEATVVSGWVTLSGTVSNLRAKKAAVGIANLTIGVTGITDRIKVQPFTVKSDVELRSAIRRKLEQDPWIYTENVSISVDDSIARIDGKVNSHFAKIRLEVIIDSIEGIQDIENSVQVEGKGSILLDNNPYLWQDYLYPWGVSLQGSTNLLDTTGTKVDDREIRERIEKRLFWSPFVDHENVTVLVENGVATLTGQVSSKLEKQTAASKAIMAGAKTVENDLNIES